MLQICGLELGNYKRVELISYSIALTRKERYSKIEWFEYERNRECCNSLFLIFTQLTMLSVYWGFLEIVSSFQFQFLDKLNNFYVKEFLFFLPDDRIKYK